MEKRNHNYENWVERDEVETRPQYYRKGNLVYRNWYALKPLETERPFDWIYSLHGYYHTNTCLAMFFPKTKIFKTLQGVMVPEKPDFSIPCHEVKITWIPDLHNDSNNWTTGNN